jgi:hypothetical protein
MNETVNNSELVQLQNENALLKLRKENVQIKLDMEALRETPLPKPPWWRNGATITSLTAIIAAVVPATTGVQGWVQKNREIELEAFKFSKANDLEVKKQTNATKLQETRQAEDIRTAYLERLKAPGEHLRTLRFILATTNDVQLRSWATNERKVVEEELGKLDAQLKHAQADTDKYLMAISRATAACQVGARNGNTGVQKANEEQVKIVKQLQSERSAKAEAEEAAPIAPPTPAHS